MTSGGYHYVRVNGKWTLEHRQIMSVKLGRPLEPHEKVGHIDGNHLNNDPANLEIRIRQVGLPRDYHCPGCRCFEAPRITYG